MPQGVTATAREQRVFSVPCAHWVPARALLAPRSSCMAPLAAAPNLAVQGQLFLFCPLVTSSSISFLPRPLSRLCLKWIPFLHSGGLRLQLVPLPLLSSRWLPLLPQISVPSFVLCVCCDPSVGGGASREHRGADEALGVPAGGEEPGAAAGESQRRRRAVVQRYPAALHKRDSRSQTLCPLVSADD